MIDWKLFNDTFEAEINAQEFEIDEAQWAGLLKALKKAEETVSDLASIDPDDTLSPSNPLETNPIPPSNGGGSQDSIDSILTEATWKRAVALRDLGESSEYDKAVTALKAEAKAAILAWHNTQLKSSIPQFNDMPEGNADFMEGFRAACLQMEARLEHQGHE